MANESLSKNRSKLKLTRRQALLFQKVILTGNQMAELLAQLEFKIVQPHILKQANQLVKRWYELMTRLGKMLINNLI